MYIGNDLRYGRSEVYYFTATSGGETSISTASDGRAIRYTVGFCTVYLNGIRLHDTDITVTSGTSVAFASALSLNDVVTVEATHPLSVANAVPIGGGPFTGAVTLPSPVITGTPTGITASHILTGAIPAAVTGSPALNLANATFPAGTLQLIATVTASGASTASFNSTYVTSAYDSYQLHVTGIELASGTNSGLGRIRFRYGGTPTYFTNIKWGAVHSQIDSTGLSNVMRSTGSEFASFYENLDDSGAGVNLIVDLLNLSGAGSQHASYVQRGVALLRSEGNTWFVWGSGVWDQGGNPTTHIEFSHSSNTFNGTVKLYGIKQ